MAMTRSQYIHMPSIIIHKNVASMKKWRNAATVVHAPEDETAARIEKKKTRLNNKAKQKLTVMCAEFRI